MAPSLVSKNGTIKDLVLVKKKILPMWHTVWPFAILYIVLFTVYVYPQAVWGKATYFLWMKYIDFFHAVSFPVLFFAHAFFSLFTVWSVRFKAFCLFTKCSTGGRGIPADATHTLVVTHPHHGESAIVELEEEPVTKRRIFFFQRRFWSFDEEKKHFTKPHFPTKLPFSHYRKCEGLQTEKEVTDGKQLFGSNRLDITIPSFSDLFVDHAFAPFFVFQMFCVLLWCMDDYWMYSLFTGFMMVTLECTVVMQRRRNMSMLRQMGEAPVISLPVKRKSRDSYASIPSSELLPGDLVQVPSNVPCPADIVLIKGSCVVDEALLTGESTPQMKESLPDEETCRAFGDADPALNMKKHTRHMLYSGTQVLVSSNPNPAKPLAIGVVLKTGFETKQGKLVRTILHSQSRVSENSGEAFVFIGFLLLFAIAAVWYVVHRGINDPSRSRWKLFLTCTQILTSVVPPELPMELSLAVNTSLIALMRMRVFCTEPFRIPFGGKVDTCCFDKTGTLTTDEMLFAGVDLADPQKLRTSAAKIPQYVEDVLVGCQALVTIDGGETAGDAMEKAALTALGWKCPKTDTVTKEPPTPAPGETTSGKAAAKLSRTLHVLSRFPFDSTLRRMSCVISDQDERVIVCKGSPESLKSILGHVPGNYDSTCDKYTNAGHRVIALARKRALGLSRTELANISRTEAECDLDFVGFAVFKCPLKKDTIETIQNLQDGSLLCTMLTGDSLQTAVAVSKQVGILDASRNSWVALAEDGKIRWRKLDAGETESCSTEKSLTDRAGDGDQLCVNAEVLQTADFDKIVAQYGDRVLVWSRCAPNQKEDIVTFMKSKGHIVLMAGDGTNDVGGLKQAHVGIAVLNSASVQKAKEEQEKAKQATPGAGGSAVGPAGAADGNLVMPPPEAGFVARMKYEVAVAKKKAEEIKKKQMEEAEKKRKAEQAAQPAKPAPASMEEMMDSMTTSMFNDSDDMGMTPMIKLGDASIAAPFTCKSKNMMAICDVIRMGRCALVTTLQMYKILALNCLTSAYSMSVLHSDGVKFGDRQMMATGVVSAICFLFLSRSQPLQKLSKERPITRVFHPYMVVSILGQFGFHLYALVSSVALVKQVDAASIEAQRGEVDVPDFRPTLLNSIVFLMTSMMIVLTFAINVKGHPFMTGLRENKPLLIGILFLAGMVTYCSMEIDPDTNEMLEIVKFPSDEFRQDFLTILATDAIGAFAVEKIALFTLGKLP